MHLPLARHNGGVEMSGDNLSPSCNAVSEQYTRRPGGNAPSASVRAITGRRSDSSRAARPRRMLDRDHDGVACES